MSSLIILDKLFVGKKPPEEINENAKFKESKVNLFQSTNLFVADPLGNVILYYSGDIDGKKLLSLIQLLNTFSKHWKS